MQPPAIAWPFTAATSGIGNSKRSVSRRVRLAFADHTEQIDASPEDGARASDDDSACVTRAQCGERCREIPHQLGIERVRLAVFDAKNRDTVLLVDVDHGAEYTSKRRGINAV
jgi:hypothetical protein